MSEPRDEDALTDALRSLGSERLEWRSQPADAMAFGKTLRRRRRRRIQAASGVLSLAVVAGVATAVVAAPGTSSVIQVEPADAAPPDVGNPSPAPAACVVPESEHRQQWLSKGGGSKVVQALTDLLDERFGKANKEGPHRQLQNGLIGLVLDDANHQVVIVVDSEVVDMTDLDRAVQAATRRALSGRSNVDVTARVHAGCNFSAELVAAHDTLMQMRADYGNPSMGGGLDPRAAVWAFSVSSQEYADAVKEKLGDLVRLTCCPETFRDRAAATEPATPPPPVFDPNCTADLPTCPGHLTRSP